jgi:HlyD family secretion protein
MRKVLIGAALVVVVAIIVVANIRAARRKGVEVDVETIGRKSLVAQVDGSGRIEARRSVDMVSSVIGKVLEVAVEEGQRVEKGQLLIRIDPAERKALLERAKAAVEGAQARHQQAVVELKQAEQELERVRGLVDRGLASTSDLEKAQTNRDVDKARLASAEQDVRDARANVQHAAEELERTIIRAEIPGVVVRLAVEEGENVLAGDLYNQGSSVVTIADLSEMEAQILVDETEVVRVHGGQKATVEIDAFPDRKFPGTVFEVGNSAYNAGALGSQQAKDFRVRILLRDFPSSLRPGLSARAEIVTDTRDSVLAVPIEALALRDPAEEAKKLARKHGARRPRAGSAAGRDSAAAPDSAAAERAAVGAPAAEDDETQEVEGVFVVEDGRALFTPVKTGIAGARHFEVLSGLRDGSVVVRGPFDALRRLGSGDRVRIRKEKEGADAGKRGERGREGEAGP